MNEPIENLQRREITPGVEVLPQARKLAMEIADIFPANAIQLYNRLGNKMNAGKEMFVENIASEISANAFFIDQQQPETQIERMRHIVPHLVLALVNAQHDVAGIYQQYDTHDPRGELVHIALDWFAHPEIVAQSVFHVVYGGDGKPSSRAPAYIIPALLAMQSIQDAYIQYEGWAIAEERAKALRARIQNERPQKIIPVLQAAVDEPVGLSEMRSVEALYHISHAVPRLVISNTVLSGAVINRVEGKEKEDMLIARNQTQQLLRAFVERFFPNISPSVISFRNDLSTKENLSLQAQLLFLRDAVALQASQSKEIAQAQEVLQEFATHHSMQADTIAAAAEIYPLLHGWFFGDKSNLPPIQ
ncbi:MAG: hypothetical protein ACREGI_00465, partial [Candidatus Levyibacteriota bacterium]